MLGVAAALRLVGIEYGLPFGNLLNPDEQTARVIVALFGLVAVAAAWWLGRRAYGTLAGTVAAVLVAVETTHVAYSQMAVTDVPLTAGIAASLALMISGRLEWAGLAAGLATGAKYPGVFLVVPLVVAGWRSRRRLAVSIAVGAVSFLATSPYVLVHPHQAAHEALRVQRLARRGWLGFEHDHFALVSFTGRLWHGLGPALLVSSRAGDGRAAEELARRLDRPVAYLDAAAPPSFYQPPAPAAATS